MTISRFNRVGARLGAVGALVLLAVACGSTEPEAPPFAIKYTTTHLGVGSAYDLPVCEGDLQVMEAFVVWLAEETGIEHERVWVQLFAEDHEFGDNGECRDQARGCYDHVAVHARGGAVFHELTHAWLDDLNLRPLPFFSEGLAMRMQGTMAFSASDRSDLETWIFATREDFRANYTNYLTSGHFMHWLIRKYGMDAALEMLECADDTMDHAELSGVFEDVIGVSLAEIAREWRDEAPDYYPGVGPAACGAGEPLEWINGALEWTGKVSCDEATTLSEVRSADSILYWRRARLEIPHDAVLEVPYGRFHLTGCLSEVSDELSYLGEYVTLEEPLNDPLEKPPDGSLGVPLIVAPFAIPAGVYEVWVSREESMPFRINMSLQ